jgi:hypothetical protein
VLRVDRTRLCTSHVVGAVKKKGARRDARERLGLPAIGCPGDRRLVASEADVGKYACLQPGQVPRYLATYLIQ